MVPKCNLEVTSLATWSDIGNAVIYTASSTKKKKHQCYNIIN